MRHTTAARRAHHTRVGGLDVPQRHGSFKGPYDEGLPRPEKIPEMIGKLEATLKEGEDPSTELVEKIVKLFDYVIEVSKGLSCDIGYPAEESELYRRFYALCIVHNIHDSKKAPMALRAKGEIVTYREITEARLEILRCSTTQEYSHSKLPWALDHFVMDDPKAAFDLLTANASKVMGHNGIMVYLSSAIGLPRDKIGLPDVLRHYKLLPGQERKAKDSQ